MNKLLNIVYILLAISAVLLIGCRSNTADTNVANDLPQGSYANATIPSMTGFPDGEIQRPMLFFNDQLYAFVPGNSRAQVDSKWILVGYVTTENNLEMPQINGTAARIPVGSEIYQVRGENVLWIKFSDELFIELLHKPDPLNELQENQANYRDMIRDHVREDIRRFTNPEYPVSGFNLDEIYLRQFTTPLILNEYHENGSWAGVFTELEQLVLPLKMNSGKGGMLIYRPGEDTITAIGSGYEIDPEYMIGFEQIRKDVEQASESIKQIDEIRIGYAALYHGTFVWLRADNEEYVIPYFPQSGIAQGKVLALEDFVKQMDSIYDEADILEHPDMDGGVPLRAETKVGSTPIWLFPLVAVIVLAGAGFIWLRMKHQRPARGHLVR